MGRVHVWVAEHWHTKALVSVNLMEFKLVSFIFYCILDTFITYF